VTDKDSGDDAELHDAIDACDQLHVVLARLKRLGLLTDDEDHETEQEIEQITDTLSRKLPEEA
jgi:hypothetical protein